MALSMTPKHQTLVSTVPLPPQFHLASSIRREFLGCGTHLRPPGLRTRRSTGANRKLGFPIQSPRCLFQNSTGDDAVLVVAAAVATFAILQLVYTDYNKRRRRDNPNFADEEQFGITGNNELYKQDEGILGEVTVGIRFLGGASFCIKPFEREDALERTCEILSYEKADKSDQNDSMHLESQSSVLAMDENLHCDVRPAYELLAYAPVSDKLPKSNGFEGLTSPLVVNEIKAVEGDNFEAKLPFFLPKEDEILAVSSVPIAAVESSLTFSVVSTEKKTSTVDLGKYVLTPTAAKQSELLSSSYDVQIGVLAKEVFDCMEEKQHALKSIQGLKSSSPEPFHLKFQDNTNYRHHTKSTLEVPHIVAKASSLTAGYLEGQNLIGVLKEGPVNKESEMKKGHCSIRDVGRSLIHESANGNFSNFPQQNGNPRDELGPATYIRTYNHMLRDGRLRDCMDVLEKMETKGLLDMNKVNHKMFLKACKSQKAVKEAFRFCKLIQNSTLSTFNMLLSVCASSQDFEGAFQVMLLVKKARLKPDCKLYTTLISTCAKSGKVDAMFEVFHEMVSAGVEPNVNTYGALIDGCARAGQVAKAFGAYGVMRSKKVQPDRVIFNALITACGQSGAVHRAFDVLAEMMAEPKPVDPDHVTVGALIKTCIQAGQVERVPEIYKMLHKYNIMGTPDVYTIAVNSCSETGNLEFALSIYNDMKKNGVTPDEMFLSTIIDVAGHAMKIDTAFEILQDARNSGMKLGDISYSSLMGACCNAKNWQKALELYEEMKTIKLLPTVSTLNALMTSLCDGDQLLKSVDVLDEIREAGVQPNIITYSILVVACEKKNEADLGFTLLSKAKEDGILLNLIMSRCLTGLCLKSLEKAYSLGEPIVTFYSGKPQIDSKWTTLAIMVYRETISARVIPTIEVFSQVLGCLQFPRDSSIRNRFIENLGVAVDASRWSNICSLLDGFGEYDTRCFSVLEEAASLGVLSRVSFKDSPIVVDARKLPVHTVEVYLLMILKGLKHRLAAGARLPNINILLPTERTQVESSKKERRTINLAGRTSQAVCSLLRRMGIPYSGDESFGKIRINGLSLRRWFKPKLTRTSALGRPGEMIPMQSRLGKGIFDQQRSIRNSNNLSLE